MTNLNGRPQRHARRAEQKACTASGRPGNAPQRGGLILTSSTASSSSSSSCPPTRRQATVGNYAQGLRRPKALRRPKRYSWFQLTTQHVSPPALRRHDHGGRVRAGCLLRCVFNRMFGTHVYVEQMTALYNLINSSDFCWLGVLRTQGRARLRGCRCQPTSCAAAARILLQHRWQASAILFRPVALFRVLLELSHAPTLLGRRRRAPRPAYRNEDKSQIDACGCGHSC